MEIDKDRVVECARAYVGCILDKQVTCASLKEKERLFLQLRDALNPPPARPSKDECAVWLVKFVTGHSSMTKPEDPFLAPTIEYLKEPSLQWVKNTGVAPECKTVLVSLKSGKFGLGERADFNFLFENIFDVNNFVELYIILE